MGRSFGIVENKVNETAFFLEKLREEENYHHLDEPQFYLSAFLSACRSVTFALQASISDLDGFSEWYENKQTELAKDKLARFFLVTRNESQKVGFYVIGGASSYTDEKGNDKMKFNFQRLAPTSNEYIPDEDVVTACDIHFKNILNLIYEVFQKFGKHIDSKQFFTMKNLKESGLTIEDFERQAGMPEGWTKAVPLEHRVRLIRESQPPPNIDRIFIHYLGKNRFGEIEE
ncbi:hypothetical protein [Aquimarina pacifica]|uniref:hypothetical protein n=1 Tax=Aquimarina pacifica TaxID=1296415 RepID=UPI0004706412|nr:hypothetical protein [Aquimarina pacifica]